MGSIYVQQHPQDAQLSVEELCDMVGREGEAFSECFTMLLVYLGQSSTSFDNEAASLPW